MCVRKRGKAKEEEGVRRRKEQREREKEENITMDIMRFLMKNKKKLTEEITEYLFTRIKVLRINKCFKNMYIYYCLPIN